MNIGNALNVKIVSVCGNTIPQIGMNTKYPNQPDKFIMIETKNLNCRPCSKIGHDKCPKKHFKCMEEIDIKEVENSILKL